MRPASYRSIIALAFLCCAAVATELVWSAAESDADAFAAETLETVGALPAMPTIRRGSLPLTDEERAQVFDGVIRIAGVPVADIEPPEDSAPVPTWVALQELPPGVAQEIPLVDGYKFVKLDDRILLVHPGSRKVVAEMPRYKLVLQ
ncbi:MAG: DUF1236 domain-containing protein [Xanthobacteraceae bacterium]